MDRAAGQAEWSFASRVRWIFGLGDGRVNVGLGILNSSSAFGNTNYRTLLGEWLASTPEEWGLSDPENAEGKPQGARTSHGFNRVPHYSRGVMLSGDCGGMVNPFNGEGIAYAMESGVLALRSRCRPSRRPACPLRERALAYYSTALKARYGGYYRLGHWFVKIIGNPQLMQFAARHGMPHPLLMRFVLNC